MDQQDIKLEQGVAQFPKWRQQGYFGFTNVTILEGLAWFKLNSDAQLLNSLIYQVSNGGFAQWISNGYSIDLNRIAQYLEQIGSPTCMAVAQLLDQLSLWDSSALGYELSATTGYFLEELDPFDKRRLEAFKDLSQEFWQVSDQLCAELDTYFEQLPEAQKLIIMDPPLSHSEFLQAWDTPPTPTWIRLMEQVQQKWELGAEAFFWVRGQGHLLKEFLPTLEPSQQSAFLFGDLLFQALMNQGGVKQWLEAGGGFVLSELDTCIQSVIATVNHSAPTCMAQVAEAMRSLRLLNEVGSVLIRASEDIYQSHKQQVLSNLNRLLQSEVWCHTFRFEVESYLEHLTQSNSTFSSEHLNYG